MGSTILEPARKTSTPILIYLAAFVAATSMSLMGLGSVFFLRNGFHASPAVVATVAVAWNVPYVLGCLFFRPLFKRLRPAASIACGALVSALAIFACASSGSVLEFALFYMVFGVALAFFWPMMMGWLSSGSEGGELGRRQGIYNMSWCLGVALGPYLAGKLSEVDLLLPLFTASAVFACVSVPMAFKAFAGGVGKKAVPADAAPVAPGMDDDPAPVTPSNGADLGRDGTPLRHLAWIGLFSVYFANGASWNVLPLYLNELLDFSKPVVGALFLTRSLAMTAAFYVWGKTVFWHFKTYPLILAQTAFAVTVLALIPLRGELAMATILAVFGAISAFCYSTAIFHGVAGVEDKARRVGIHEAILAAAAVTGSITSGLVYQEFSMGAVFAGCAGLCFLAAAIQTAGAALLRKKRGADSAQAFQG